MKIAVCLLMIFALVGCDSGVKEIACRGSYAAANPGKWMPTDADLHK